MLLQQCCCMCSVLAVLFQLCMPLYLPCAGGLPRKLHQSVQQTLCHERAPGLLKQLKKEVQAPSKYEGCMLFAMVVGCGIVTA